MIRLLRSVERLSLRPLPVTLRQHPHYCSLLQSCKSPLALSLATIKFMFNTSNFFEHRLKQMFQQYDPEGISFMKQRILRNATQLQVIDLLSIPPIRASIPHALKEGQIQSLLYYIYNDGFLTKFKSNENYLRFPNLFMEKYFYDKIVKDWIEKVSGLEIEKCQNIALYITIVIAHIKNVQYFLQSFLSSEVKKKKNKVTAQNANSENQLKLTELEIALHCIWRIVWSQRAFPTDQLILLSPLASPTTAVVTDFKIVPSNIKNQQKAAEELLEQVIWSILGNWHQQSAACLNRLSKELNKIENIQIVAIIGHSKQKIWIESHIFTKEKWIQLAQFVEEFIRKKGNQLMQQRQDSINEIKSLRQTNSELYWKYFSYGALTLQNQDFYRNKARSQLKDNDSAEQKLRKELLQAKISELKATEPSKQWTQPKGYTILKTLLQMFEIQGEQKILKDSPLKREEDTESNAQDAQQSSNQENSTTSDEKTKE